MSVCIGTSVPGPTWYYLFAKGSAKPWRELRFTLRIEVHTGKKETKYMGADSLGLSPRKRPLVDRNRKIDFLK